MNRSIQRPPYSWTFACHASQWAMLISKTFPDFYSFTNAFRKANTIRFTSMSTRPGRAFHLTTNLDLFVSFLEKAGGKVWNVFTDDGGAFEQVLRQRCGEGARFDEVTDASDIVCFFPSLTSEIAATVFRRELDDAEDEHLRPITRRIDALRSLRPYSGGGRPFIEGRLSAEWQRRTRKVVWPTGSPTT